MIASLHKLGFHALVLLALAIVPPAKATARAPRYLPLPPWALALRADLVVDGTIIEYEDLTQESLNRERVFTIHINEVVAGEFQGERLQVFQFENWTSAHRYALYDIGQRALFHLVWPPGDDGVVDRTEPARVIGAGNEGECPIIDGRLFHRGFGWLDVPPQRDYPGFVGVVSARAEYIAAVTGLRKCYRWSPTPDTYRFLIEGFEQLCSDEEVAAFEASSEVAKRFVAGVRDYYQRDE